MQFQIVQFDKELGLINNYVKPENLDAFLSVRGMSVLGQCNRKGLRAELQGQPIIDKLCGPMWGGTPDGVVTVRYEDSEANDIMSS